MLAGDATRRMSFSVCIIKQKSRLCDTQRKGERGRRPDDRRRPTDRPTTQSQKVRGRQQIEDNGINIAIQPISLE